MNQITFSRVTDRIFSLLAVFLLAMAWLRYYIDNLTLLWFTSISVSVILNSIIYHILNKRISKAKKNKATTKAINDTALSMRLMSTQCRKKYLSSLLPSNVDMRKKLLISKVNDKNIALHYSNIPNMTDTDVADVFSIYNHQCDRVLLIADSFDKSCSNFVKNISNPSIVLLDKSAAYQKLYIDNPPLLDISIDAEPNRMSRLKEVVFARHNAKRYLFSSLILLFSSYIIPYNVYYLSFSTMLLLFSIICVIKPYFIPKISKDSLF